jgi:hypothetical protein
MNYSNQAESSMHGILATGGGLALAGMGLAAGGAKGLGNSFLTGAMMSFGADPLESGSTFKGSVFAFGDEGGSILKNSLMGKGGLVVNFSEEGVFKSKPFQQGSSLNLFTRGGGDYLQKGGLAKMGALNFVAPALFTGIGTINAMMDGGISGGFEYLVQDAMGMAAANSQLNRIYSFDLNNTAAVAKVEANLGVKSGEMVAKANGASKGYFNLQRTMLGSPMLGMLVTSAGGIAGAGAGMEAGKSLGKFVGRQLGDSYETAGGFLGGMFGGFAGASIGASMAASLPRLAISAAGIAATTMIAKGTYSMLESGFRKEKMRHSRGLNFASDTSQFMTQRAVTMRQRAMQSMHKSHLNARSAFGQEASITHMNRDMFSHYKR